MWLKIKEGETIIATIDFSSTKSVTKHWTGQRSELCLGSGCPHCLAHIPKRWRYQARLIVDGNPQDWEFGEQAMIELKAVPHETNLAHITITRLGDDRSTRYRVAPDSAKQPSLINYQAIAEARTQEAINSLKERDHGNSFEEEG